MQRFSFALRSRFFRHARLDSAIIPLEMVAAAIITTEEKRLEAVPVVFALNRYNKTLSLLDSTSSLPRPSIHRDPIFDHADLSNLERPTDSVLVRSSPGLRNQRDRRHVLDCVDVPGVKAGDMSVQRERRGSSH
jgi:hypothetical protein